MKLTAITYAELNSKQKEIYNFQKVAAVLADYGFNCIRLSDDWQGADFLAYHKDGHDTLKVQLKSRLSINSKYQNKKLYMAFPIHKHWYLVEHDALIEIISETTNWLNTDSWLNEGLYTSTAPNKKLLIALSKFALVNTE
jgi:hypothetical protein